MTRAAVTAVLLTLAVVLLRLRVVGWGRRPIPVTDWVEPYDLEPDFV